MSYFEKQYTEEGFICNNWKNKAASKLNMKISGTLLFKYDTENICRSIWIFLHSYAIFLKILLLNLVWHQLVKNIGCSVQFYNTSQKNIL